MLQASGDWRPFSGVASPAQLQIASPRMIIQTVAILPDADATRFCWRELQRFQNVRFGESLIEALHSPPSNQKQNVKKQAAQIKYCLAQAREYYEAGDATSMATRPLLYYYFAMSMALAEILLKQSGESSLDRAREHHDHHGLQLQAQATKDTDLQQAASALRARPARNAEGGFGTFELWHRSARHFPICGETKEQHIDHGSEQVGSIYTPSDHRMRSLDAGISFFECIRSLPAMQNYLEIRDIETRLVRTRFSRLAQMHSGNLDSFETSVIVQQTRQALLDRLLPLFLFEERCIGDITQLIEPKHGLILSIRGEPSNIRKHFVPDGVSIDDQDSYLWDLDSPLNEFGYYYVGLYILGNYVRYYPDLWMRDVENSSDLFLAASEFIETAKHRIPVVSMSEMTRTSWVRKRH